MQHDHFWNLTHCVGPASIRTRWKLIVGMIMDPSPQYHWGWHLDSNVHTWRTNKLKIMKEHNFLLALDLGFNTGDSTSITRHAVLVPHLETSEKVHSPDAEEINIHNTKLCRMRRKWKNKPSTSCAGLVAEAGNYLVYLLQNKLMCGSVHNVMAWWLTQCDAMTKRTQWLKAPQSRTALYRSRHFQKHSAHRRGGL